MMTVGEIEVIQRTVAEAFGDPVGIRDAELLQACLHRPFATENGIPVYPTLFNKISAVFHGILEHKPFKGANRRTGLCVMVFLLERNGYELHFEQRDLEGLVTGVELGFTTVHRTTAWIKGHAVRGARFRGR